MQLEVNCYSHYFTAKPLNGRATQAVSNFSRRYIQWGFVKQNGRFVRAPIKNFFVVDHDRVTFRFHIGQYNRFKEFIEQSYIPKEEILLREHKPPEATVVSLPIQEHWVLREDQEPVIDYMTSRDYIRKFLALQTGKGKGLCSMWSASIIGKRIGIVVKAMYMDKWHKELLEVYDISVEDIMVVQGSESLKMLLDLAMKDELETKVILISNATIRNWIKTYEEYGDDSLDLGYACRPQDMFEVLGVGLRIIDELHQDFHFNYILDLYTNIEMSYSLSATLVSDDSFLNNIYQMVHHETTRFKGGDYDRYCAAYSILYHLKKPEKIRYQDYGRNVYSHVMFEQSIMRHIPTLNNYMAMINKVIESLFIKNYKPGYKLMVFCATIELCTKLTEYLAAKYPKFDVRRYVEKDPFENVIDPDIRVSTLISAGTAIDIKGLYGSIQTTVMRSSPGNLQSLGRLRKMPDGTMPWFAYLSCVEIDKHMEYDHRKRELLNGKAAVFKVEEIGEAI